MPLPFTARSSLLNSAASRVVPSSAVLYDVPSDNVFSEFSARVINTLSALWIYIAGPDSL